MRILLLEPYFTGSHRDWALGYARNSQHEIAILQLKGAFWKWRMHGGAITLANRFLSSDIDPDLIIATDMLDFTTFMALTRERIHDIPSALYFHENQICYPWSPSDRDILRKRDRHYGFINYTSALAADKVFFNSEYHRSAFLAELEKFLRHFPDHRDRHNLAAIERKSDVLHLGLDLARFERADEIHYERKGAAKLLLWNHRWEYDKNPAAFFEALSTLRKRGKDFQVALLGESFNHAPSEFETGREMLGNRVVYSGYVRSFPKYAGWLRAADILPVTSKQDFFGASTVEAAYNGCLPILPRRLAYPEIFGSILPDSCFYHEQEELVEVLHNALKREGYGDIVEPLRDELWRFDWTNMAPIYDATFQAMRGSVNPVTNR